MPVNEVGVDGELRRQRAGETVEAARELWYDSGGECVDAPTLTIKREQEEGSWYNWYTSPGREGLVALRHQEGNRRRPLYIGSSNVDRDWVYGIVFYDCKNLLQGGWEIGDFQGEIYVKSDDWKDNHELLVSLLNVIQRLDVALGRHGHDECLKPECVQDIVLLAERVKDSYVEPFRGDNKENKSERKKNKNRKRKGAPSGFPSSASNLSGLAAKRLRWIR
jgi:hypothetical protein